MASTITALTSGGGLAMAGDTSGQLELKTNNGTTAVTVTTAQKVGIGTTSPAYKLDVNGSLTANGSEEVMRIAGANSSQSGGINIKSVYGASASDRVTTISSIDGQAQASPLAFGSGTTEVMRIDSSGNLLVGTTSSSDGGGICLVKSANGATIANFTNSYGNLGQVLRTTLSSAANNTSSYSIVCNSGNDRFYVYGNGNVVNSNNSYGTLSDIKLKENIADATPKLDDVLKLQVRNFTLKTEPDQKQIGFIAQELEEVFPSLIDNTTPPNDSEEVIKSIKTSVLIPILVKAIQELNAKVVELEAKVNAK